MANSLEPLRMIHVPDHEENFLAMASNSFFEYFVLLINGAPASATIGKIDISLSVDYIPKQNTLGLVPVEYPLPGIRT